MDHRGKDKPLHPSVDCRCNERLARVCLIGKCHRRNVKDAIDALERRLDAGHIGQIADCDVFGASGTNS